MTYNKRDKFQDKYPSPYLVPISASPRSVALRARSSPSVLPGIELCFGNLLEPGALLLPKRRLRECHVLDSTARSALWIPRSTRLTPDRCSLPSSGRCHLLVVMQAFHGFKVFPLWKK